MFKEAIRGENTPLISFDNPDVEPYSFVSTVKTAFNAGG
jgi:hypothetical protein